MKGEVKGEGKEKYIFPHPLPTHFSQTNMAANSKMAANLRSRAPKHLGCRLFSGGIQKPNDHRSFVFEENLS